MKKRSAYTLIILFVLFQNSYTYSDDFTLTAKFGPIKKIIYKFSYEMNIENNEYNLKFNLSSQNNFLKFITNETIGIGLSEGIIIKNSFIAKNYQYTEKKEDS